MTIDEQLATPDLKSDDAADVGLVEPGTAEPDVPGPWRESDGTPIPFSDAKAEWARVAHDILVQTAKQYNGYLTYAELARLVLEQSGIHYRPDQRNWIGKVLGLVADQCVAAGEPALTSLCVSAGEEKVGANYLYVLKLTSQPVPEDLQAHAAEARLKCYRFYGADMPRNGGEPTLTRRAAARRAKAEPPVEKPVILCPVHFSQLPVTGQCDLCD